MTAHPFDAAAPDYDAVFTNQLLGQWLRQIVRDHVTFIPNSHILELGCGTGEDALWLASQGLQVTATDASLEMLSITAHKAAKVGIDTVSTRQLNLNYPDPLPDTYDGVFTNFGVVNCVKDRTALAEYLAEHMHTDGKIIFVVMGPICPWEILIHIAQGDFKGATRRFRNNESAHVGDGEFIEVWYPSPSQLIGEFAPTFKHIRTVGVGTLLPPSYMAHWVERWPKLFARFETIDRHLGGYFPLTYLNDHYLVEFKRR